MLTAACLQLRVCNSINCNLYIKHIENVHLEWLKLWRIWPTGAKYTYLHTFEDFFLHRQCHQMILIGIASVKPIKKGCYVQGVDLFFCVWISLTSPYLKHMYILVFFQCLGQHLKCNSRAQIKGITATFGYNLQYFSKHCKWKSLSKPPQRSSCILNKFSCRPRFNKNCKFSLRYSLSIAKF